MCHDAGECQNDAKNVTDQKATNRTGGGGTPAMGQSDTEADDKAHERQKPVDQIRDRHGTIVASFGHQS